MKKIISIVFILIFLFGCINVFYFPTNIKLEGESFIKKDGEIIKTRVYFIDQFENCYIGNGSIQYYLLDGLGRKVLEKKSLF